MHNSYTAFIVNKMYNMWLTSNSELEVGDIDAHVILRSAGVDAKVVKLDAADVQYRHNWILFVSTCSD